jgi:2-desacetyl-2-hydroxyethyl bacteriochlorophyllide A dehydrogenase
MRDIGIEFPERGQMRFYELGPPGEIKPTEVLIRTHYSGITNGTERHALLAEHGWVFFPGRHGYQHVGRVEAVGDEVKGFKPGDWVYFGRYVGHRGWHIVDVSWTDLHSNNSHLCMVLPGDVDYRQCALLGVAGVAMRGVRRCRVEPAQRVWVAGAGPIGQFAAQAARAFGAEVTVTEINERRLAVAKELGAHRVIDARRKTAYDELREGGPYDRIIDACGAKSLFMDIHRTRLLAYGGAICALAVRTETVFHWAMLHDLEASIEVSCHYSLDDLRVVLHFVRKGTIKIEPLISHFVSIEEAPSIYEILRDRPGDLLGVIFDWTA